MKIPDLTCMKDEVLVAELRQWASQLLPQDRLLVERAADRIERLCVFIDELVEGDE